MSKWRIGEVTITKILDFESAGGTNEVLPQATPEAVSQIDWLSPHFIDEKGRLKMSLHALVVETPSRRIIVDTCIGNDKQGLAIDAWNNQQRPFLRDLVAAGFPRKSFDTVMCTHLHMDHVGWNTMKVDGKWVPTFPNARYLMAHDEFRYWKNQTVWEEQVHVMAESIMPVVDAGLVDLIATDHVICDEVSLVPTLGHTPGHVSVRISSRGEEALITGDFIHHPCQMAHPDWALALDYDQAQSTRTRREVFSGLADRPVLVIGTHFATPTAGRVVRDGDAFRLRV